jgi:hypothetical protein
MHHLEQQDEMMIDILHHLETQHKDILDRIRAAPDSAREPAAD